MSTPTTGHKATKKQRDAVIQMMRLNAGELEAELRDAHEEELQTLQADLTSDDFEKRLKANERIAVIERERSPEAHAERVRVAFERAVADGAYADWTHADWKRIGNDPPKRQVLPTKFGKQELADWMLAQENGTTFTLKGLREQFNIKSDNTIRAAINIAEERRPVSSDGQVPATFTIC